ncbi:MAG TPA: hypothetical protein VKX17_09410 [Planctomycetota bacterium]|nr:hypothetical protein [Planctomycetota bacterium]
MATPSANLIFPKNDIGLFRWLLREAVRANPLYVISAALLAYAIQQLMEELDAQVGRLRDVLTILALLHVYECAVLIVATVVLKRRARGGLDMHGLMIVAALFLGASFIALDELAMIAPLLGLALTAATLILAALKAWWYAQLPGVWLPLRYRGAMLAILGAHALSVLLGSREIVYASFLPHAQNVAWLCGWAALAWVLWLVAKECAARGPSPAAIAAEIEAPAVDTAEPERPFGDAAALDVQGRMQQEPIDPLATRMCGVWAVSAAAAMGVTHLFVSDWILERPIDVLHAYPALSIVAAALVLLRRRMRCAFGFFDASLSAVPAVLLGELYIRTAAPDFSFQWNSLLSAATQLRAAAILACVVLAHCTGWMYFYAGLVAPLGEPAALAAWRTRGEIAHFRAWLTAALGFAVLIAGMLVSLYRERLLRWLAGAKRE